MAEMVAQMTKDELRQMIEASVERTLVELFGDPDEGLVVRDSVRRRLLRQKAAVEKGERGRPLEEVVKELGLD